MNVSRMSLQVLLPRTARCLTCGKAPAAVEIEVRPFALFAYRATFRCHGATEWLDVGEFDSLEDVARQSALMFARSVARHGALGQAGRLMRAARPVSRHQTNVVSRGG